MSDKKNNFLLIKSTLILTLSGLINRLLGFFYRIYMTNKMGAECVGLYQLILPVYTLAWSISCAGFTTAISKIIAQEKAKKNNNNSNLILNQSLFMSLILAIALSLILYFNSNSFSDLIFKDPRVNLSLKILAFCFPFMAAGSCFRGYFLGLQKSSIPAISQVLEQIIHMSIICVFINKINSNIKYTCALAVLGMTLGEFFSCLYVYLAYKNFNHKNKLSSRSKSNKPSLRFIQAFKLIISIAFPLAANKIISSGLYAIENILIPQRLVLNGFNFKNAISLYGKITGMAIPLIYFPSVFLISLSVSLVPEVSHAHIIKNQDKINNTVSKTILITSIIGLGAAAFFIIFSQEIGLFIYKQNLAYILKFFGFMCPFIYLQIVLAGILNGLGKQVFIFKNNLLASSINLFFIYFFIPRKGINAFIFGWLVSLIISCLLSLNIITKSISIKLNFSELILKPFFAVAISIFIIKSIAIKFIFKYNNLNNILGLFLCALVFGLIYISFIISTGCIETNDLKKILGLKSKK